MAVAEVADESLDAGAQSGGQEEFTLVYDTDLRAPACVLLQAVFGCGASPRMLSLFDSRHWLTAPTPGMCKMVGTEETWKKVAEVTRQRWGEASARAQPQGATAEHPVAVPRRRQMGKARAKK